MPTTTTLRVDFAQPYGATEAPSIGSIFLTVDQGADFDRQKQRRYG